MPKMKWTGWRNWKSPALVSLENARALKMVQWSWLPLVQHLLQHLLLSWPQPHPEEDWLWTSWPTIMWLSRGAFMDTNLDIKVCPLFNVIWLYVKSLINFWLLIVKVGSKSSIGESCKSQGSMSRWWRREEVPKSWSPRVPRFKGQKVQYLKVTFKYELNSKEGPSCSTWGIMTKSH